MDTDHAGSGTATIAVGYLVECIQLLRPGFSRLRTHVVRHRRGRLDGAGDLLGVTSIVRA